MINPESGVISVADDGDLSIEESGELYDMEVKVRIMEKSLESLEATSFNEFQYVCSR